MNCNRILADDEVVVGEDFRSRGKSELDAAGESPSGKVHAGGGGVVQLDEFERNVFVFRILMDFVDDDLRTRSGDEQQAGAGETFAGPEHHANARA